MRRRSALSVIFAIVVLTCPVRAQEPVSVTGRLPSFHGFLFADMGYSMSERNVADGFFIGQLVGHGNARLSQRLSFFGELSATARDNAYAFEVERAILRYDFFDMLKVSAGRYHTPVSYWNTAYHHGLWLQTSVSRPELIRVGGTFLPVHFIGAQMEGTLSHRLATFSYEAGVGNGRGDVISRGGDAGDTNGNRAIVLTARLRPSVPFGLQLGGSLYFDRVSLTNETVDERIASAHVVWDHGAPELIAEYVTVRHEPTTAAPASTSDGFYVQTALRLPGRMSSVKPYVRGERINVAQDAVFATLTDYDALVAGVRWDFESFAALKAEGRRERLAGGTAQNSLFFQVALVVGGM